METKDKILYFQYTLHKLMLWFKEVNGKEEDNDLSILKSLKLLFFVSAAKTTIDTNDSLVDNVFTSYVAMPYGHVEEDIYSAIQIYRGNFDFFFIDNAHTVRKKERDISELVTLLNARHKQKIDESVDYLKSVNRNLISLPAFDLVELSHLWYSWRKNYNVAIKANLRKWEIAPEDIKTETKVYNLQAY